MKPYLSVAKIRNGKLEAYRKFAAAITGPRKQEYADLLKRYGLKSTIVWIRQIDGKDYAIVYHDVSGNAHELLKGWLSSTHPFDVWFREQLAECYEDNFAAGEYLFDFHL